MKKSLYTIAIVALVGGMLFSSCKKDSDVVTLKAQIERVGGDSKVWLNSNDTPVFFQQNEKVKINGDQPLDIVYSGGQYTLTPNPATNYYAVYPASIVTDATISGTTVNIKLPHLQNYVEENGHQKIDLPCGAVITNNSSTMLRFYNLCSLIEVQCTIPEGVEGSYTISSIEVTAEGKGLWGEGTATLAGASSAINIAYNGKNSRVVLEIPSAQAVSEGQSTGKYYVVVPPYSGSTTFTVKVRFNQGKSSFTATKTGAVLGRNIIVELSSETEPEEDNEISGYFSISSTQKVVFSKGNLQHHGAVNNVSAGTWFFAENQYDFYGANNFANPNAYDESDVLSTTVDLFSWSMNNESTYGQSNVASPSYGVRAPVESNNYDFSAGSFRDWGNLQISGDPSGVWFTLSPTEWSYMLNTRPNAAALRANTEITGVTGHPTGATTIQGFLIFPDDWTEADIPSGITLSEGVNSISVANWKRLEAVGAVFLPAAGYRSNTRSYVDYEGTYKLGNYWTNSRAGGSDEAYYMAYTYNADNYAVSMLSRDAKTYLGHAVRLVKSAPGYQMTGRWATGSK